MITNINGRLTAVGSAGIPLDSRAFRYGYGLFETMRYEGGTLALGALHWARLFSGMEQLHFEIPVHLTPAMLEQEVHRTVRRNGLDAMCRIRLQVWPGAGGLYDADSFTPQFIIECFPLQKEVARLNENGLTVGIANGLLKSRDTLAGLKTANALIYAVGARQAKQHKWNDALILNTNGRIIETTTANLFWIKNEVISTPPLEEGCIAGVMRQHLLSILAQKKIMVVEQLLTVEEISDASEVLTTNAIRKIKWIKELKENKYRLDIGRQLAEWLG
jgi:branched-chain amino acid aminotransferase